jgi:hypothetical protein
MQTTLAKPAVTGEIARRGQAIYEETLRHLLEKDHHGEYLAIDVDTGEYILAPTRAELTRRTFEQGPGPVRFAMRIGYPAMIRLGGARRG